MVFHPNAFSISQCQHFALTHDSLHIFSVDWIQITIETYISALLKYDRNCNIYTKKVSQCLWLMKLKCQLLWLLFLIEANKYCNDRIQTQRKKMKIPTIVNWIDEEHEQVWRMATSIFYVWRRDFKSKFVHPKGTKRSEKWIKMKQLITTECHALWPMLH